MSVSSNVMVQAASVAQRSAIVGAHAAAQSLVQSALNGLSSPSFTTWFGTGNTTTVQSALTSAAATLTNATFAYDLVERVVDSDPLPGTGLIFDPDSTTAYDVVLARPVLATALLDPGFGQSQLAAALVHEAVRVSNSTCADLMAALDPVGAQALAVTNPNLAVTSLQNFVGFVTSFAQARTVAPVVNSGVRPQKLSTTVFDENGAVSALRSTDFSGVSFDAEGRIIGGRYHVASTTPNGTPKTATDVTLVSGGRPTLINATIFAGGRAKKQISADYSGLQFGPDHRLCGGGMTTSSTELTDDGDRSDTTVAFSKTGDLATTTTVRYCIAGRVSTTAVDYSGVQFNADHRPIGGTAKTVVQRADGTVRSSTDTLYSESGMAFRTVRYDSSGKPLSVTSLSVRGDHTCATVDTITYAKDVPVKAVGVVFEADGQTARTVTQTDFSSASFDKGGNQNGGSALSTVRRRDRTVQSRIKTVIEGGLTTTTTANMAEDGEAVVSVLINVNRPDGTRLSSRALTFHNGVLLKTVSESFAADGLTSVSGGTADFSGATVTQQGRILGGAVVTRRLRPDQSIKSDTIISYG